MLKIFGNEIISSPAEARASASLAESEAAVKNPTIQARKGSVRCNGNTQSIKYTIHIQTVAATFELHSAEGPDRLYRVSRQSRSLCQPAVRTVRLIGLPVGRPLQRTTYHAQLQHQRSVTRQIKGSAPSALRSFAATQARPQLSLSLISF